MIVNILLTPTAHCSTTVDQYSEKKDMIKVWHIISIIKLSACSYFSVSYSRKSKIYFNWQRIIQQFDPFHLHHRNEIANE